MRDRGTPRASARDTGTAARSRNRAPRPLHRANSLGAFSRGEPLMRWQHTLAALAGSAIVASGVAAAEPQKPAKSSDTQSTAVQDQGSKILAARTFRASKLSGLNVRN